MMTAGKLVRDKIPNEIRDSGRHVEVRQLSGEDLTIALVAKLFEEAQEAAEAVGRRDRLIEELADVTEVISALREVSSISDDALAQAIRVKALHRGRFDDGTFLVSEVPEPIYRWRVSDVDAHRVKWIPDQWKSTFKYHEAAHADLQAHSEKEYGIARSFIHHYHTDGDPVDLFLMVMAWGYGRTGYGPSRTSAILDQAGAEEKIGAIVDETRNNGAAAGWNALLDTHHINGLGMSFGTKLLYFAGYGSEHSPRPLILDELVRASLQKVKPRTVPAKGLVSEDDYLRYLQLAEDWAEDPAWKQQPDVVEYGLFTM
jgi:predicted house-cleaning noncanonical NTP pyrophosphatase (MazG superfamily)